MEMEGARIERLSYGDTNVTVFGDVHTGEHLERSRDRIDQEMAAHDGFAWEARGYRPDTWLTDVDEHVYDGLVAANERFRTRDMNSFDRYVTAVDDMALDHFDESWGPDSHHAFPYAFGMLGPLIGAGTAGYVVTVAVDDDADIRADLRADLRDLGRMLTGEEHDWGERDLDTDMDRREFLTASAGAGIAATLGWLGGTLSYTLDGPDNDIPDDWTYTDMRDVFTAQGVDRIVETAGPDDLLVLVGKAHVDGIARYLADPAERERRLDRYGPVLDTALNADTRMARWTDQGGYWERSGVVDLY